MVVWYCVVGDCHLWWVLKVDKPFSMLSSKIKLTILYIINMFRGVLVTPKTNTNIPRYFVLGNKLFIFLKISLTSIFGKHRAWWSEIVSLNITEFLS